MVDGREGVVTRARIRDIQRAAHHVGGGAGWACRTRADRECCSAPRAASGRLPLSPDGETWYFILVRCSCLAVLVAVVAFPRPGWAVPERSPEHAGAERRGLYVREGNGTGYTWAIERHPHSDAVSGLALSGSLAIGGTLARGVLLGGELRGSFVSEVFRGGPSVAVGNTDIQFFQLGPRLDWFPDPAGGWHFGALLGLGALVLVNGSGQQATGAGPLGSLIGGYDLLFRRPFSLGVDFVASGTPSEKLYASGADTGYRFVPVSIALEVSILMY